MGEGRELSAQERRSHLVGRQTLGSSPPLWPRLPRLVALACAPFPPRSKENLQDWISFKSQKDCLYPCIPVPRHRAFLRVCGPIFIICVLPR